MPPKVELKRIRKYGEIVDDSILFFKQNYKGLFKCYFTICGFFWLAGLIISVLNQTRTFQLQERGESIYSVTYFLTVFVIFLNVILLSLTALSFVALYFEKNKETPTVEEVWSYVKYYFLRVLGSSIVLLVLTAGGFIVCVLPGIYLMPVFVFIITVMVLENASFGYAFKHAFYLIKGNWWQIFGVLLLMGMLVFSIMVLSSIPVMVIVVGLLSLTSLSQQHTILLATVLTFNALQFLLLLPCIATALIYYSLNLKRDDHSLFERIEMLGKHDTNTNQLPTEEY